MEAEAVMAVATTAVEAASMEAAPRPMAADIIARAAHTAGITAVPTMATAGIMGTVDIMATDGTVATDGMAGATGATRIMAGDGASDGAGRITGVGAIRTAIGDTRRVITPTRAMRRITGRAPIRTRIRILTLARRDISAFRMGTGILRREIRQGIQGPTQIRT